MKIIKQEDNYLLKNDDGEYHISHEQFESIGEEAAIELAESEIKLKNKSSYQNKTINFKQARLLGFCNYGIEDFCERLGLDIDETYSIDGLNKLLTVDVLKEYPDECIKLFGKNTLKYLGGIEGILSHDTIDLVLREEFIPAKTLHLLSVKFSYMCLDNFEKEFPYDKRPRYAIEAKEAWIRGDISDEQLAAAWSVAESAAESAARSARSARSAARSARSAVRAAAWSAAESAWSAAESAARSARAAAWSARSAARAAAESAAESARSARSARSAWSAARAAAESARSARSARSAWSAARAAAESARSARSARSAWSSARYKQVEIIREVLWSGDETTRTE